MWVMQAHRFTVLTLFWLAAAEGCATQQPLLQPAHGFTHRLGRTHVLAGRILDVAAHTLVAPAVLFGALNETRFALLGETHDNRDHHLLQAQLIEAFAHSHPRPSVGFEMLDETQAAPLAQLSATTTPETLAQQVAWSNSGWPAFELYRPVFAAALAGGGRIVAAHPSTDHVRASLKGVDANETRALHLDQPLPESQQAAQREEIRESHCGHAPDAMVSAMQSAQSYKDAFMARALVQAGPPALLITGRGHARKDRGVPLFLQRSGAGGVLSIAFMEVVDDKSRPSDYDVSAFDFVVFTPRETDEDPCEQFKRQLEAMHQHAAPPAP
jgi:uncharacterized iron-regulated protein